MATAIPSVPDGVRERASRAWSLIVDYVRAARRRDILLAASSLAFYALLSAVPVTIAAIWLASLVIGDGRIQALSDAVKSVAPDHIGADQAVQRVAQIGTQAGFTAVVAAAWPATSYGAGLARALQRVGGEDGEDLRAFKGRVLLLIGLFPLIAFGGLVATAAGAQVLRSGRTLGLFVGLAAGLVVTAAVSATAYKLFPQDPPAWGGVLRGAVATAVSVGIASLGFQLYLRLGADFGKHYATSSLGGIVLLGVYLYLSNALLLVGYTVARGVWREERGG